ncbi:MAG: hypothetical protein KAV87_00305 [Desulfobacteraceae bacterium]|nr:hypothetical protein [Desulfobacteraceae bacterium]
MKTFTQHWEETPPLTPMNSEEQAQVWFLKGMAEAQKPDAVKSRSTDGLTGHEIELLERIAYCATGMFEEKNSQNHGNAGEWERHLENATRKYNEFKYS